jgi:hypothetical protein
MRDLVEFITENSFQSTGGILKPPLQLFAYVIMETCD